MYKCVCTYVCKKKGLASSKMKLETDFKSGMKFSQFGLHKYL